MDVPEWQMEAAEDAYSAYCYAAGGKSLVSGETLPVWDNLPGAIKNAWHSAAMAAIASSVTRHDLPRE